MTAETQIPSKTGRTATWLSENRSRVTAVSVLIFFFIVAMAGVERDDWFSTVMQGLSVGAITFLVASGLSLIFGLMDVLNLAHGELFMLGAYVGWTVYTRFDTLVDLAVPALVVAAPFALLPLWRRFGAAIATQPTRRRWGGVGLLVLGVGSTFMAVTRFPLAIWNAKEFAASPTNFSVQVDLGILAPLPAGSYGWPPVVAVVVALLGGSLLALGFQVLRPQTGEFMKVTTKHWVGFGALLASALLLGLFKGPLNEWVFQLTTTWRFLMAIVVSVALGAAVGALIEVALIRPLYDRPIYQLMVTLGVGFVIIEMVREVWGRPEFTMSRPAAFNGTGPGCPGEGLGGFFSGCSTVDAFGSRLRVYNEGFVILAGIVVLVGVTLLLRRTRIGMIIRAGVQDPEMVQALGINVRQVFTLVFALGSGLAALGGVLAAPSIGLSTGMGAVFLLSAIVALAVGGLTSFPGAAAGAVLVGLLQQIIIRYGQAGIALPFLDEPFKPSPTLVPAAAILLMMVVLLVLPAGLFGRSER